MSNGSGVYHAEGGFVGVGASRLMITHFVGGGRQVGVAGRYFDPVANRWFPVVVPGGVYQAEYRGRSGLQALSLSEAATVPTWTLEDPRAERPHRARTVTGDDLLGLKLYLRVTLPRPGEHPEAPGAATHGEDGNAAAPGLTATYVLEFGRSTQDRSSRQALSMYELRWRELSGPAAASYCVDGRGNAEPVVFQGGIAIDPDTARVTRDASADRLVTLSCRSGAPATVYSWGYRHREDAYYFDAALQMKRASYCGDGAAYTQSPTSIEISDDRRAVRSPIAQLEARWTPTGASCVNRDSLRHPEIAAQQGFTFTCEGRPLPPCTASEMGPYLASGVVSARP